MLKFMQKSSRKGYALYQCECGNQKEIRNDHVRGGKTNSCGCLRQKTARESIKAVNAANIRHGMAGTKIYIMWSGMKDRCQNPNNKFYNYYGGRGITVCERWQDFSAFYADMGDCPEKCSIDRMDNNKGYSPENCRWATKSEQATNRRSNRRVEFDGKLLTISEISRETGVHWNTISGRLNLGWGIEKAISQEKHINTCGLSLGGKANGARNSAKTHCKRGHEFTPENTAPNGKNGRKCRRCHADRQLARKRKHLSNPQ